jgi:hypothetical protein
LQGETRINLKIIFDFLKFKEFREIENETKKYVKQIRVIYK